MNLSRSLFRFFSCSFNFSSERIVPVEAHPMATVVVAFCQESSLLTAIEVQNGTETIAIAIPLPENQLPTETRTIYSERITYIVQPENYPLSPRIYDSTSPYTLPLYYPQDNSEYRERREREEETSSEEDRLQGGNATPIYGYFRR